MSRGIKDEQPDVLAYHACDMRWNAYERFSEGIEKIRVTQPSE